MGITLSAAIQIHFDAQQGLIAECWDTVSIWEFNKDYKLMAELGDTTYNLAQLLFEKERFWWPEESRYSDCLQVFEPKNLPDYEGVRYRAMLAAVKSLGESEYGYKRLRVLFWRD